MPFISERTRAAILSINLGTRTRTHPEGRAASAGSTAEAQRTAKTRSRHPARLGGGYRAAPDRVAHFAEPSRVGRSGPRLAAALDGEREAHGGRTGWPARAGPCL